MIEIRDVGGLLQFAALALALPVIALCVFWVIRRVERERK